MLARVVVENGVKKLVPLTADCGSGNPVGTVIAVYSNKVPNGYLPCNGVAFDTAQFPVLYALLGDNHTPDLRECTLVGIGQSDRAVGAHDVYTIGQFKDDQLQNITGSIEALNDKSWIPPTDYSATGAVSPIDERGAYGSASGSSEESHTIGFTFDASRVTRTGTTTHGKQVGVNWCIKATSGINENQADNVLSALSPVDTVTSGDMHSVTSGAVYSELATKISQGTDFGNDKSTSTITLGAGIYMFLSNFHPLVNQTGLYFISIASRPNFNKVFTVDNNSTITLSVSSSSNVLTLTTTTVFRGLLIKVSDSPAV